MRNTIIYLCAFLFTGCAGWQGALETPFGNATIHRQEAGAGSVKATIEATTDGVVEFKFTPSAEAKKEQIEKLEAARAVRAEKLNSIVGGAKGALGSMADTIGGAVGAAKAVVSAVKEENPESTEDVTEPEAEAVDTEEAPETQ